MPWIEVHPIIDVKIKGLCTRPYPGHKKGCPNFSKRPGCPPNSPLFSDVIDISQPVYAIYNIFPFKEHVEKMRAKWPDKSERFLRCCLYWQKNARKQLREQAKLFLRSFPHLKIITCPEAQGVNLTETMKNAKIVLEWPPENVAFQIILAGNKK